MAISKEKSRRAKKTKQVGKQKSCFTKRDDYKYIKTLYFRLNKDNNPMFSVAEIIRKANKKFSTKTYPSAVFRWIKKEGWRLKRNSQIVANELPENSAIKKVLHDEDLTIEDAFAIQELKYGVENENNIHRVLRDLVKNRKEIISGASERANEISLIGLTAIRIKYVQMMRELKNKGISEINVDEFFTSQESVQMMKQLNDYLTKVGSIQNTFNITSFSIDQRNQIINFLRNADYGKNRDIDPSTD